MKISIALATYNGEKYIRKLLESLESQKLKPHELVVTDDCSTDRTVDIVKNFAQSALFPVKIYVNEKNIGFRDNFINAIRCCESEAIALCDQDDIWDENKLLACTTILENDSIDAVVHGYSLVDENLRHIRNVLPANKDKVLEVFEGNPWKCWPGFSVVFKTRVINHYDYASRPVDHNFPAFKMAHDQWICFILFNFGRTHLIAKPLAMYRQHASNAIGYNTNKRRTIKAALHVDMDRLRFIILYIRSIKRYIKNNGLRDEETRKSVQYWEGIRIVYHLRFRIFKSKRVIERLIRFFFAATHGIYRLKSSGGFGNLVLFKDFVNVFQIVKT